MSTALEILLEQATKKVDEATRTLATTRQQLGKELEKLEMLEQYMQRVMTQQQEQGISGSVTGFQLQNQKLYSDKIAQALAQQLQQIEFLKQTEAHHVQLWQEALAEQNKFEVVIKRKQQQQMALEAKRDQKMNDEFAARIHRVRVSGE